MLVKAFQFKPVFSFGKKGSSVGMHNCLWRWESLITIAFKCLNENCQLQPLRKVQYMLPWMSRSGRRNYMLFFFLLYFSTIVLYTCVQVCKSIC